MVAALPLVEVKAKKTAPEKTQKPPKPPAPAARSFVESKSRVEKTQNTLQSDGSKIEHLKYETSDRKLF